MPRVFILGAGASRFAGYPLASGLWPFIRDTEPIVSHAKERATFVTEAMNTILEVFPPDTPNQPNLEHLFTQLDLAGEGRGITSLKDVDWPRLRPQIMGMISWAFQWHQHEIQRQIHEGKSTIVQVLDKWATVIRKGDTLITFNWDLLHEAALWRRKSWHYADGYGFRCQDASKRVRSGVRILKLHGSVNWSQRDEQDCEPSIEHKGDFFPVSQDGPETYRKRRGQRNEGRNLIIPSYLKDLSSNALLLRLWNQASDALIRADELIVVGFHLHRADALARHLVASALLRNTNRFDVRVITPGVGSDNWETFCSGIGRKRRLIRKPFEEWILEQ